MLTIFTEDEVTHSEVRYFAWVTRWILASVLGIAATLACAGPGLSGGSSADELLSDADQVLQKFDSDNYDQVWMEVAPFVQSKLTRDQFIASMRLARHEVGTVSGRGWASVTRISYSDSGDVPDGLYANVDYATTRADGGGKVFELLSFRLESDGRWHLTGYRTRPAQDVSGARTEIGKP